MTSNLHIAITSFGLTSEGLLGSVGSAVLIVLLGSLLEPALRPLTRLAWVSGRWLAARTWSWAFDRAFDILLFAAWLALDGPVWLVRAIETAIG